MVLRPYSIINEKSLLYIVSREKLLIVLNRIETLTNIYSIKRDMYSFCVNLYKYVNSTGIADGLFDWLLKCYTHTGVEDYLGKPPSNSRGGHLGIARKGGGVSTLAWMVRGTFLEKNFPCSNGHLLDFGGV